MTRIGRRVEPVDKIELLGRQQTLLALEDNDRVSVDGIAELVKRRVVKSVEVRPGDHGAKLFEELS